MECAHLLCIRDCAHLSSVLQPVWLFFVTVSCVVCGGFDWPRKDFPVALVAVRGWEQSDGTSFYNECEANEVVRLVKGLLSCPENQPDHIGVVSPYGSQVLWGWNINLKEIVLATAPRGSSPVFTRSAT